MSAHVLLNLLKEFGENGKMKACRAFYRFCPNSIIQEHKLFII